MVGIGGA
ncbi:unnamed protein product, partial [Rotaria sp. Silwood1]